MGTKLVRDGIKFNENKVAFLECCIVFDPGGKQQGQRIFLFFFDSLLHAFHRRLPP